MKKYELNLYKKLLLDCERGDTYIEKFYQYKKTIIPPKIYRYRSCNEKNIEVLFENKLFFSQAEYFNDAFDCLLNIDNVVQRQYKVFNEHKHIYFTNTDIKQIRELEYKIETGLSKKNFENIVVTPQYTKVYKKLTKYFKDTFKYENVYNCLKEVTYADYYKNPEPYKQIKSSIICFSEKYDDILMWSHYADNNKGFCLEYSTNNINTHTLYPIMYEAEPPCYPKQIDRYITLKNYEKNSSLMESLIQTIYTTTKYENWSYEQEWRYFDSKEYIEIIPTAIYLGINISKTYEEIIKHYAKLNNITIKKMVQIPSQYKLEARNIINKDD